MIIVYILVILAAILLGLFIGFRLKSAPAYNGVIKMVESDKGIVYTLELSGHPEDLVFQEYVCFKVIPPNYEDLQELLRDENL